MVTQYNMYELTAATTGEETYARRFGKKDASDE